jgi:hypothetical protein
MAKTVRRSGIISKEVVTGNWNIRMMCDKEKGYKCRCEHKKVVVVREVKSVHLGITSK